MSATTYKQTEGKGGREKREEREEGEGGKGTEDDRGEIKQCVSQRTYKVQKKTTTTTTTATKRTLEAGALDKSDERVELILGLLVLVALAGDADAHTAGHVAIMKQRPHGAGSEESNHKQSSRQPHTTQTTMRFLKNGSSLKDTCLPRTGYHGSR